MIHHKILNIQRKPICFDLHTQGYSEAYIKFAEKYKNMRQIFRFLLFFLLMKKQHFCFIIHILFFHGKPFSLCPRHQS